jgi:hypothetical protein
VALACPKPYVQLTFLKQEVLGRKNSSFCFEKTLTLLENEIKIERGRKGTHTHGRPLVQQSLEETQRGADGEAIT